VSRIAFVLGVSEGCQECSGGKPEHHSIAAFWLIYADWREPTSGLEPLTPAHYECAVMCCRDSHGIADPAFLAGFLCCGLLRVAPYCVPGGVRVVSRDTPVRFDRQLPSTDSTPSFATRLTTTSPYPPQSVALL
jgi:hypothetical protein